MGSLAGRTALVTGGSRGIGRGIAERLAADGALVAVHYGNNEAAAKEVVAAIEASGGRAFSFRAELGMPGDAEALWSAFDGQIGEYADEAGVDILVNNAGVVTFGRIDETDEADFDRLLAVNVKAPFFVIQHGLSRLRDGGRIINLSSVASRVAMPGHTAYSMTKGAMDVLTLTLARDLGARGITVNAVAPGMVDTDMVASVLADSAARRQFAAYSAFDRLGRPADIADVVAFVASDDARWLTGQILDATGGAFLGA